MSKNIKNKEAEATSVVDSVKISELQETLFLNENDVIPVVQNGETKKFKTKVLHGLKTRVVDNTTTGGKEYAWSAEQGKLIHNRVAKIETLTPVWQDHNGANGSLTINDGFEETIKDLVVRGKTLGGYNAETGQSDNIVSSGEAEGNKIIVKSIGKNLIDYQKATFPSFNTNKTYPNEIIPNGVRIFRYSSSFVPMSVPVYLQANKSYKPSGNIIKTGHDLGFNFLVYKNGVSVHNKSYTTTFTPTESGIYEVGFENSGLMTNPGTNYTDFTNIQLEENTLATEYEPYKVDKKEILLPMEGGLKELDVVKGEISQIEQRTEKEVFNGSEEWRYDKENKYFYILGTGQKVNGYCLSNKYKSSIALSEDKAVNLGNGYRVLVRDFQYTTVEQFKASLHSKNMELIYELKEPIIHNIEKLTLPQYAGTTHLIIENEVAGDISCKANISLSAQGKRLREENQKLKIENEKLKDDLIAKSEYFHSNDMTLTHSDLELDFRMLEIEFALDIPININMKGKVKDMAARTPYEMIKVLILGGSYDRADFEYKISVYVKRGRMTQAEADELIALMDADELQNK